VVIVGRAHKVRQFSGKGHGVQEDATRGLGSTRGAGLKKHGLCAFA
jgi:hypothetical protein